MGWLLGLVWRWSRLFGSVAGARRKALPGTSVADATSGCSGRRRDQVAGTRVALQQGRPRGSGRAAARRCLVRPPGTAIMPSGPPRPSRAGAEIAVGIELTGGPAHDAGGRSRSTALAIRVAAIGRRGGIPGERRHGIRDAERERAPTRARGGDAADALIRRDRNLSVELAECRCRRMRPPRRCRAARPAPRAQRCRRRR